jgi:hypothetical protein
MISTVTVDAESAACESRAGRLIYAVESARNDPVRLPLRRTGPLHRSRVHRGTWRGLGLALMIAAAPTAWAQSPPPADRGATDSEESPGPRVPPKPGGLRMSRAVVCQSIDGYEDFKALPGAAQTSDEKLLIYYRPQRYKVDQVDGFYIAHLVQDNEIRKKGKKEIVRQKKKLVEYRPRQKQPLGPIYMRNTISLKGLRPGEYELTIILRDELDKGAPPSKQVVTFKVIPAVDPRAKGAAKKAEEPPAEQ